MARIPSQSRTLAIAAPSVMLRRSNDTDRQEDCSPSSGRRVHNIQPTESRGGSAGLQDQADLRRHRLHDLPV